MQGALGGRSQVIAPRARADLYAFLAGVFLAPPTETLLSALRAPDCLDELALGYGAEAIAELRGLESTAREAAREFDALFRVPVASFVAPYESIHAGAASGDADRRARLYGESCRGVAALMREAGARMPDGITEPPDHVGSEFLFLSFLCEQESDAAEAGEVAAVERSRGRQALFLREHTAAWFGALAERIREEAPDGLYAAVASFVERVLSRDLHALEEA